MTSLVTGANGHLGNNVVRHLLANQETLITGLRNTSNNPSLEGISCKISSSDLLNKESLIKALKGVDVLYQVGEIVIEVTAAIKKNLQIDWYKKPDAKAQIMLAVRRVLRNKGVTQEFQDILTEIMEQAEARYREYIVA